jgi:sec-independent protein translocase protein TatA
MGNIGALEITLIILVLLLLFGAKKLPELARGSGRALRIFKAETKGLMDDDEEEKKGTGSTDSAASSARPDPERTREIEGRREPLRTDSVRTDVSYDEHRGDQH